MIGMSAIPFVSLHSVATVLFDQILKNVIRLHQKTIAQPSAGMESVVMEKQRVTSNATDRTTVIPFLVCLLYLKDAETVSKKGKKTAISMIGMSAIPFVSLHSVATVLFDQILKNVIRLHQKTIAQPSARFKLVVMVYLIWDKFVIMVVVMGMDAIHNAKKSQAGYVLAH